MQQSYSLFQTRFLRLWNPFRQHPQRLFSYIPMAPPPLFDMCVRQAFDEALERAQTHPHEARFKHPRNWTALHCCVEHVAPLPVVKAILKANPEALTTKDWQGITPAEAAVDRETKAFLQQALQDILEKKANNKSESQTTKETSPANNTKTYSNDPMLLGKVLVHANNLSSQVSDLHKKTEELQKEVDELKATIEAMSAK